MMKRSTRLPALLCLALLAGCDGDAAGPIAEPAPTAATLRKRTASRMAFASQFIPRPGQEVGFDLYLSPLLLVEHGGGAPDEVRDFPFGALRGSAEAGWSVDRRRPVVYFETGEVELGGRTHDQRLFLWLTPGPRGGPPAVQGVRMTFGSDAFPVIHEVLETRGGLRTIYVSRSIEDGAREAHGEPLPGRDFAVETAVENAPDVVVARILAVGPVPMGPFVYLRADGRDVVTLLCRCSASQVDSIQGSGLYELAPLESLGELEPPLWAGDLDEVLRLPAEF